MSRHAASYRQASVSGGTVRVYLHDDGRPSHWSITQGNYFLVAAPGETHDCHGPGWSADYVSGWEVNALRDAELAFLERARDHRRPGNLVDVAAFCREGYETRSVGYLTPERRAAYDAEKS